MTDPTEPAPGDTPPDGAVVGSATPDGAVVGGAAQDDAVIGELATVALAFDASPAIHLALEGAEHRIVAINAVTRALLGGRPVLGLPFQVAIPELIEPKLRERLDKVYLTGRPVAARDWRIQIDTDADGRVDQEWFSTFLMSPWLRDDGSVRGVLVQAVDTTRDALARRRVQLRAGDVRRRYRAAQATIGELQRALLPTGVPVLPQLELAARYLVADAEQAAGGDWFDAFVLADHRVAVIVGDVVGHGVSAAAVMSQLRAVWSHAVDTAPGLEAALQQVERFAGRTPGAFASTVCVVMVEPATGQLSYLTCGHPAPLLLDAGGGGRFLTPSGHGPLGTGSPHPAGSDALRPGESLLLFTDGLVERADRTWETGLAMLATVGGDAVLNRGLPSDVPDSTTERICAHTVDLMTRQGYQDDVTVIAVQRRPAPTSPWYQQYPAEAGQLAAVRSGLRGWLRGLGASNQDVHALTLAASEAAANSVEHAYPDGQAGVFRVQANLTTDGDALVVVADDGRWLAGTSSSGRGRGLTMVADAADELAIDHAGTGTVVRVRRRLNRPVNPDRSPPPATDHQDLQLTIDRTGWPDPVLTVRGPLDLSTAGKLRRHVLRAARGGSVAVTVDLSEVTQLGSIGVSLLLALTAPGAQGVAAVRLTAAAGSPAAFVLDLVAARWQPAGSPVDGQG